VCFRRYEGSSGQIAKTGNQISDSLGRYIDNGGIKGGVCASSGRSCTLIDLSRSHYERGKIWFDSIYQQILFIEYVLISQTMIVSCPVDKGDNIALKFTQLLRKDDISVRQVASTVGLLSQCPKLFLPASMFCRHLRKGHIEALAKGAIYAAQMSLSVLQEEELTIFVVYRLPYP
jgi:hypothetical protein